MRIFNSILGNIYAFVDFAINQNSIKESRMVLLDEKGTPLRPCDRTILFETSSHNNLRQTAKAEFTSSKLQRQSAQQILDAAR